VTSNKEAALKQPIPRKKVHFDSDEEKARKAAKLKKFCDKMAEEEAFLKKITQEEPDKVEMIDE
jgi:hypothetical protein